LLRTLATKGWGEVGGPASWGKLKLAQTDPTRSNSAMTALTLMYQEWAAANPGKSINDKGFLAMMGDIEGSAHAFAPATSELIKSFGTSHGTEDIAIVYESDAIRAIQGGAKGLTIVYPSPTAQVTVPAAVVQGAWVTDAEGKLGQEFVDYLVTDDVQAKALAAGYRPVNASLEGKTDEAMAALKGSGVAATPHATAAEADTKTKEGLIFNWDQWNKKRGGG
jgi:ABC-type sulfate transport system substrate-binding protein